MVFQCSAILNNACCTSIFPTPPMISLGHIPTSGIPTSELLPDTYGQAAFLKDSWFSPAVSSPKAHTSPSPRGTVCHLPLLSKVRTVGWTFISASLQKTRGSKGSQPFASPLRTQVSKVPFQLFSDWARPFSQMTRLRLLGPTFLNALSSSLCPQELGSVL